MKLVVSLPGKTDDAQVRKALSRYPSRKWPLIVTLTGLFSLVCSVIFSSSAFAEVLPINTLGRVGATDLQIRTGNAVQAVCGQFIAAGGTQGLNELEADLFDKCGEMVHTGRTVTGEAGATAKSLSLTREELQGALQNIAGEEYDASGSMATEASASQSSNIGKRMSALLSKSSSLQLSSVNLFGRDSLYIVSEQDLKELSGGNAGDEDLLGDRLGIFINGDLGMGEKDATDGEDGFAYDSTGFTVGLDYQVNNNAVLGLAGGVNQSTSDFDTTTTVSGGSLETENNSLSTYALFYQGDWFFDSILTFGQGSFDMERSILIKSNNDNAVAEDEGANRTALGEADTEQLSFSFGGGIDLRSGNKTLAPYFRLNIMDIEIDAFEETGAESLNLKVEEQSIQSSTSAIGFRVSSVSNTSFGVFVPQGHLEWVHEYSDSSRQITMIYVNDPRENKLVVETDDPDRDYFSLGLGASAVFKGGTQAFIDVKSILGLKDFTETAVTLGVRFAL